MGVALPIFMLGGSPTYAVTSKSANSKLAAGEPPWSRVGCIDQRYEGVVVCFEPLGDKFWIGDTLNDGHHVAASFDTDSLELGACHDYHGSAGLTNPIRWTYCDQFADHISEHQKIRFLGLVMEGSRILYRSSSLQAPTT
jgi:hypothetical protein